MKTIPITPQTCNLKTLACWYKVCTKTMSKRIKKLSHQLGNREGERLFFVKDAAFGAFGYHGLHFFFRDSGVAVGAPAIASCRAVAARGWP